MLSDNQTNEDVVKQIKWQAEQPMLTSSVIIKQVFIVLAIPVCCLLAFLLLLALFEGQLTLSLVGQYFLIALILLGGLLLLAAISILLIYGNKYETQFTIDENGVSSNTIGKTKRKNAIVNGLLLLSGRPGAAGAGLLAASRQGEMIKWKRVDNFVPNPTHLEIQLRQGRHVKMLIRCTPENYQAVLAIVKNAIKRV